VPVMHDCRSARHGSGPPAKACYRESVGILPWLWGPEKAAAQLGLVPTQREKVCSRCRTACERARRKGAPPVSSLTPAPPSPPSFVAPIPLSAPTFSVPIPTSTPPTSGLDLLAKAADECRDGQSRSDTGRTGASIQPVASCGHLARVALQPLSVAPDIAMLHTRMVDHLRATKPRSISFAFKNGVTRQYVSSPMARLPFVQKRQLNRRAAHAAALLAAAAKTNAATHRRNVQALFAHAQRRNGVCVVPMHGREVLSPELQARLVTKAKLSRSQWSQVRHALGGKASGLVSREVVRKKARTMAGEASRQVTTDDGGARLVSARAALQCLVADLIRVGLFVERHVRGADGRPVPHTKMFTPQPGPYKQHDDATADVHVCVGMDKGDKTSTCKLVATVANQSQPQKREHSILLATYSCTSDGHPELTAMIGPWVADLQDLLTNGITVNGRLRAVRLLFNGDFSFLSNFCGHLGATCHMSCLWCLVVRLPSDNSNEEAATYGNMQRAADKPRVLRTRAHLQSMAVAYVSSGHASLATPLPLSKHFSIERCPIFDAYPEQIVPLSLHITLGVTSFLLQLDFSAVVEGLGEACGRAAALAVGRALVDDARVRPVPYHGGGFQGRSCHKIAAKGVIVCDKLAPYLPPRQLAALRVAWDASGFLAGVLNRAEEISPIDVATFDRKAAGLLPPLQAAFPWISVSVKIHVLAHHAPAFLRRFGSLGIYGDQAMEAWHGFFIQRAPQFTAENFLGSCLALVQHAAIARDPCAAAALDNGEHRRPAVPGARRATKPGDMRLRINKPNTERATAASTKLEEEMQQWAEGRVTSAVKSVAAYRKKTAAPEKLLRARKRAAAAPADAGAPATASVPAAEAAELAATAALAILAPPLAGALPAHAVAAAGAAADWGAPPLAIALPEHAAADAAAAAVGDLADETLEEEEIDLLSFLLFT